MSAPERVKQRILRQAVRENLDTIRGLPPHGLGRRWSVWAATCKAFLVVGVLSGGLAAFNGLSREREQPGPALATSAPLTSYPAPRPLDPITLPLAVKKIVLDPGHGGRDGGARTPQGIWEKEITLDVARHVREFLAQARYDVAMTRDADLYVSLRQRAQLVNAERADLFVSVHVNSVAQQDCHAIETYYLGPADDPRAEQVAGFENRESGYSLADFRRLLEGVYVHVRQTESRILAEGVHRELIGVLGNTNPVIRDKGVRSAPFLVLVATESPGILAEVSCLSNDEEARRLTDPAHQKRIARALFLGIHAYAEARNRTARAGPTQGATR